MRYEGRCSCEVESTEVITGMREVQAGSWNTRKRRVVLKSANFNPFLANFAAIYSTSIIFKESQLINSLT